ncbi:hypothetical protein NDU88_005958 [Pleurodeles waltl]|uniref:Uncharacterized protein n=1 Tax=Pleurodeles waltl TaxID=8319 RepID=A0AAV7QGN3_PLEWA|nr:hypothetical protein NDU88_005958 [Pleurodeles waltl]
MELPGRRGDLRPFIPSEAAASRERRAAVCAGGSCRQETAKSPELRILEAGPGNAVGAPLDLLVPPLKGRLAQNWINGRRSQHCTTIWGPPRYPGTPPAIVRTYYAGEQAYPRARWCYQRKSGYTERGSASPWRCLMPAGAAGPAGGDRRGG